MPELTEEQRARLAQQEAREQAHEVLSEKENTAPGLKTPEIPQTTVQETAATPIPDIRNLLKKPEAEASLEAVDAIQRAKLNVLLGKGDLKGVMAQLEDDPNEATKWLEQELLGDQEQK